MDSEVGSQLQHNGSCSEEPTSQARSNFVLQKHKAHVSNAAECFGLANAINSIMLLICAWTLTDTTTGKTRNCGEQNQTSQTETSAPAMMFI